MGQEQRNRIYHPGMEHDACGIGAIVDLKGNPSHDTVDKAIENSERSWSTGRARTHPARPATAWG